jgi:hypothetical protein
MSGQQEQPLRIAAVGMDARSQAAMEMVFKGPGRGAFVIADAESAQISIVDLDGAGAADLWASYKKRFPSRPVIVLSITEQSVNGAHYLRKPVGINALFQVLQRVKDELQIAAPAAAASEGAQWIGAAGAALPAAAPKAPSRVAAWPSSTADGGRKAAHAPAPRPDVDALLTDPEQRKLLFYSPDDYVGGRVVAALGASVNDGRAREITCWNSIIVALPEQRRILTDVTETRLKQFGLIRLTEGDGRVGAPEIELRSKVLGNDEIGDRLLKRYSGAMQQLPMEPFLWKLATYVSRGRAPAGTDLHELAVLRHWPNLTRLHPIPHALRITALWLQQPRSLRDIAATLRIPIADVLTFYSAASAIGLVASARRQSDRLFEPAPLVEHQRRGMLQRILGRLLGGG